MRGPDSGLAQNLALVSGFSEADSTSAEGGGRCHGPDSTGESHCWGAAMRN